MIDFEGLWQKLLVSGHDTALQLLEDLYEKGRESGLDAAAMDAEIEHYHERRLS